MRTCVHSKQIIINNDFLFLKSDLCVISEYQIVGSVVTVANVGDSRVVLGYQQELFPSEGTETINAPKISQSFEYDIPIPTTDTAATTPEDCGSIDCSHAPHTLDVSELDLLHTNKFDENSKINLDFNLSSEIDSKQYHKIRNIQLSSDHKPDVFAEKSRIMLAG